MFGNSRLVFLKLTLVVALFAAMPLLVGAEGHVQVVWQYDPAMGELPEGIAVDKVGNLYVDLSPLGQLWKIRLDGSEQLLLDLGETGSTGLAVDAPGNVYMAHASFNPLTQGVYRVSKKGNAERLPGTEDMNFPNGLAFDQRGNLYVTDSALGAVWRIPRGGSAELWLQDPLLEGLGLIPGYPPIGANGIAYRNGLLYVVNLEKALVARIPIMPDGSAGTPELVVQDASLFGLDGIALDVHGNIYALLITQSRLVRIEPGSGNITEVATAADNLDWASSLAFGTGKGDRQSAFVVNYALGPQFGEPPGFGPAILKVDLGVPGLPLP